MALLKPGEAAAWLRVSERHLAGLRAAGTGPRYVRGGKNKAVRYPPEELEAWTTSQLVSSTSEEVAAGRRSHKVKTEAQHEGDVV